MSRVTVRPKQMTGLDHRRTLLGAPVEGVGVSREVRELVAMVQEGHQALS